MKDYKCFKCQKSIQGRPVYGLHARCFVDWFVLHDNSSDFYDLDRKPAVSYSSAGFAGRSAPSISKSKDSFYHGRYRKYSAKLGDQQYILKVQEQEFPDLPAMEYLCNKIATLLGIKVPDYYLIRWTSDSHSPHGADETATPAIKEFNKTCFEKGVALEVFPSYKVDKKRENSNKISIKKNELMAFVTKNFMQGYPNSALHHIYKFLPKRDKYNCQNIIKAIMEETNKPAEVEKFIKICLFDSFIGNGDRHGRNLGIIGTGRKKRLAPMYDNPSNFGGEPEGMLGGQFNYSGHIWTSSSEEPKIKDYIQEFQKLNKVGFAQTVNNHDSSLERQKKTAEHKIHIRYNTTCLQFIQKIITKFPEIIKEVQCAEISEKRKQAFICFLNDRLKDLEQILKEDGKNV